MASLRKNSGRRGSTSEKRSLKRASLGALLWTTVVAVSLSPADAFARSSLPVVAPLPTTANPPDDCVWKLYSTVERESAKSASNVRKKKKKGKSRGRGTSSGRPRPEQVRPLSRDELVQHVSSTYVLGHRSGITTMDGDSASNELQKEKDNQSFEENQESDPDAFLDRLRGYPALVLNADYQPMSYLPLSIWSWQDAIKAIFSGKVTVVDVYPDMKIRAASIEVPVPSVIALNEYVPVVDHRPAFTRRNVFLRDEYKCQYCSGLFHTAHLTLDHVYPKSLGGSLTWENTVTCCSKCNGQKGSLTIPQLRQVGMKLRREPFVPTQYELAVRAARMVPKRVHPTWAPYLGFLTKRKGKDSFTADGDSSYDYEIEE